MVENYTNVHRAFLQACGRFSVMHIDQALKILASVQAKHGNDQGTADDAALRGIVNEINAKFVQHEIDQRLNFVQFKWDQFSVEFLVLCNAFAAIGPTPTHNDIECAYMKILMEKIVTSDAHSISMMAALHLCTESSQAQSQSTKKITKQRAEELLDEWTQSGYFFTTGDILTLGPKALAEFRDTMRTKFPDDIQNCHLCSEIAMQPKCCPNADCETPLDKHCFESYVLKQKKCPACKSVWHSAESD